MKIHGFCILYEEDIISPEIWKMTVLEVPNGIDLVSSRI